MATALLRFGGVPFIRAGSLTHRSRARNGLSRRAASAGILAAQRQSVYHSCGRDVLRFDIEPHATPVLLAPNVKRTETNDRNQDANEVLRLV